MAGKFETHSDGDSAGSPWCDPAAHTKQPQWQQLIAYITVSVENRENCVYGR